MNRRSFFKWLGIGTTAAIVVPKLLADSTKELNATQDWIWKNEWGPLVTWQEPKGSADYSIGVEVGSGLEHHSPSCISVMRMGGIGEPDRQVAEFTSTTITPPDLTLIVAQIARKYSANCTDPRGPLLVIEQVRGYGDVVQNQLKIMGFTRFFVTTKYRLNNPPMKKDGWYTTAFSAPILANRFSTAIRTGWYKPRSVHLNEIANKSEREMLSNSHIMAAAQSYAGRHNFDDLTRKG